MKRGAATAGLLVAVLACLACGHAAPGQSTQDRFIDSSGVRIRFQVLGQGPPVVLIHGFGESLESWHQRGVVRALSPHFKVIAMDVRGHGRSSKPHDPKSYGTALSGDVVRLLRHLGDTKAHVVGYSMGALVALDVAVLHQEHTLSVVLGGAGWNPPEALDGFRQQAEAFEKGEVPVREGDDAKALAAMLRGLRVLSEEEVRRIQVPVAVLIGTNDRFMANVRRLSGVLPGLEVMEISDADHATAPGHPKFAQELLAFLQKQNGATRVQTKVSASSDFDYLLGDWEFTAESKQWGTFRGLWSAVKLAEGQILDEYRVVGDEGETYYVTTTFRNRNEWLDVWDLVGADAGGGLRDFGTARRVGEEMHIQQTFGASTGAPSVWRIRYHSITADRFLWVADRSTDGGRTWVRDFQKLEARRVAPARTEPFQFSPSKRGE